MMSFTKIAFGALLAMPLVLQPAFAQQSSDATRAQQSADAARAQQKGVAETSASAPANTPPPTRTGDGQVVNSNPNPAGSSN